MRVKVFGHNFKSKAELALLLGVSTRYSPRNTKGVNVPVKDVLSEKDIMERFGFKSKKEARMWLANLINEAGHGNERINQQASLCKISDQPHDLLSMA